MQVRRRLQTALLLSADACLRDRASQECIYNHFLHSKEAKRVLSGKQSKVLPAINGSSPACGFNSSTFANHAETLAPAPLCSAQEAV
jgi:hypothetical protein